MGPGGISPWSLLLILVIVLLLFGTKKLRNVGSDLGGALKGFKGAMSEGEKEAKEAKDSLEGDGADDKAEPSSAQRDQVDEKDKTKSGS